MRETELIETIQSHLASKFSVPVRTAGMDNERPVPAIILDDWDSREVIHHNTPVIHENVGDFDDDGVLEFEQYLRFDYRERVEFVVRHSDEVEANRIKDRVKEEFRLLRANPRSLHPQVRFVKPVESGNPTYNFGEPKESEIHIAAILKVYHELKQLPEDTEWGVIRSIQDSYEITE